MILVLVYNIYVYVVNNFIPGICIWLYLCLDVALESKLDGLIVSNTTIERPSTLKSVHKTETGGLSGKPLFEMSTKVLRDMYKLTSGKVCP